MENTQEKPINMHTTKVTLLLSISICHYSDRCLPFSTAFWHIKRSNFHYRRCYHISVGVYYFVPQSRFSFNLLTILVTLFFSLKCTELDGACEISQIKALSVLSQ